MQWQCLLVCVSPTDFLSVRIVINNRSYKFFKITSTLYHPPASKKTCFAILLRASISTVGKCGAQLVLTLTVVSLSTHVLETPISAYHCECRKLSHNRRDIIFFRITKLLGITACVCSIRRHRYVQQVWYVTKPTGAARKKIKDHHCPHLFYCVTLIGKI